MNYRPEIDGLRALAVLAVIVFHADEAWFPGGFVGVDIFFVVSGYLITGIIINDLNRNDFSFARFYERRARRILPALYVVLAACIPFAALWLLPAQRAEFGHSVVSTVLFSSNILFWSETGYFMAAANLKPLLHTWSLGVEEQFYFLYPLLLVLLWRLPSRWTVPALAVLLVASLGASTWLARTAPLTNFYFLPTRAWELLAGALCVFAAPLVPGRLWPLAALGLAALVATPFYVDSTTPVPSLYIAPLIAGTALVLLFAPTGTPVARLLGWRPLVALGLISYSAYLWHLPLMVFARIRSAGEPSPWLMTGLAAASLVLAAITYFLVERPLRKRGDRAVIRIRPLVALLSGGAAALVAAGLVVAAFVPPPRDGPLSDTEIEARLATNYGLSPDCEGEFTLSPACRTSDTPELMLWGDSFAMHLAPAFEAETRRTGMIQHTKSVCAPILGLAVVTREYNEAWAQGCIAFNDKVVAWLAGQRSIRYVVISSPFGIINNTLLLRDGTLVSENQADLVRLQLIETAQRIRAMGKQLIIVSPPPVTGANLGQCLATAARQGLGDDACDFTRTQTHPVNNGIYAFLRTLEPDVPVFFLDTLICPDTLCDTRVGAVFMFRDEGHLSVEGSRLLGERDNLYGRIKSLAAENR